MSPQLSEHMLAKIFVETDDLYQDFQNWSARYSVGRLLLPRKRTPNLCPAEVATICIAYQLSGYKCFEYYYRECLLKTYGSCFPKAPSYKRFVALTIRALPLLLLLLLYKCSQAARTGHYFIDSKKLEVCHIRREHSHKVFRLIASKGKGSVGWFFGLKLHLVINHLGQIVKCMITPANVADNNHNLLRRLLSGLSGRCAGDKGYQSALFEEFCERGMQLLVRPRRGMRHLPVGVADSALLRHRPLIESVNDILATVCDVAHSRHRNPYHGIANMLAAVIAYQYLPVKPHLFIPGAENYLQQDA
jgi:hypothetical protein